MKKIILAAGLVFAMLGMTVAQTTAPVKKTTPKDAKVVTPKKRGSQTSSYCHC